MVLRQEDLPRRTVLSAPLLDPALETTQMPLIVATLPALHQILEQRLGLQLRSLLQARRDLLPILGERVRTRPPRPRRRLQLRGQTICLYIPPTCIPVHPGPHGGQAYLTVLAHFVHQLPHLCVLDQSPGSSLRRTGIVAS